MSKVGIITDSTAYIPQTLVDQYDIKVIPQTLVWGQESFKDGVDILPGEFYARLENAKIMPSTSQASPGQFKDVYQELLDQGKEVLTIVISAELSGTYSSAIQAKEMFPEAPSAVIDSRSAAMATGFQVLEAARLAEKGASLAECREAVENAKQCTGVLFAVDTLEFLHRGGRIGGGARLLGTALNIKPILHLSEGRVEPLEKVRTRKKSLMRLLELAEERVQGKQPLRLAALHANARDDAEWVLEEAGQRLEVVEKILADVSPVVGTHTGPGTVGLAYLVGM